MRIIVSCIPYDNGKSGISVYVRHVIEELSSQGHELVLIIEPDAKVFFQNYKTIQAPKWTKYAVFSMLYHLFILPFQIKVKDYDFCLITAANRRAFMFYRLYTIAVVHDLAQYHVEGKYDIFRMFYLKKILPFFVRRASQILSISNSTAVDLQKFWKVPKHKIKVVYNGLSLFEEKNPLPNWRNKNNLIGKKYILYISRIESPGKNHINLIKAFELLPENIANEYVLVCAGANWHGADDVYDIVKKSPRKNNILFTGFLANEDLEEAYTNATVYIFPSFFEGFGLSLIEAMHYKVACCCSNNSSLGEIGEGAALLFDPYNIKDIADVLYKILSSSKQRETLITAGSLKVKQFTWHNHVCEIINMYKNRLPSVVLGMPIANVTTSQALECIYNISKNREEGRCKTLVTLNVDFIVNAISVFFNKGDRNLFEILRKADFICADGMPLVILSYLLGCPLPERVAGADIVPLIAEYAEKFNLSIYLLGGESEKTNMAKNIILERHPKLRILGVDTSFVSLDNNPESNKIDKEIQEKINKVRPDLILLAFGNPKQELWLEKNAKYLDAGAAIGIGGSFNFLCGAVKRAPVWVQNLGMEWIYRIIQEPKRLWKRYFIGFFKFGYLSIISILSQYLSVFFRNKKDILFVCDEKSKEVILSFNGIRKIGNYERFIVLKAILTAKEKGYFLKIEHLSLFVKMQLYAHRIMIS